MKNLGNGFYRGEYVQPKDEVNRSCVECGQDKTPQVRISHIVCWVSVCITGLLLR
jgi:hypothetical protein